MMNVIKLTMVIIVYIVFKSNHYAVYFKFMQNYMSITSP